jgi:hypothetical protein
MAVSYASIGLKPGTEAVARVAGFTNS